MRAGDNLQAAINAAQPGDTLLLEAGATFSGNFLLPVKPGAAFITLRTDVPDWEVVGPDERITPATAARLAKIKSPNNAPALATVPGSHHWRLVLLEFQANWQGYGEIMQIGDGSRAQNTLAMVPHHIELDRLYIHGDPLFGQKRGIALNAAEVTIRNCYISDIKAIGMDTQAIGGWNGPGPFTIENNYLEAAGENLLLGGADPAIPNLVSDGVIVRHNYLTKPLSWKDPIIPTPTGLSASETMGGSLAAGTYTYTVVARRQIGGMTARSTASASVTVAVDGGSAVGLTWPAVEGATQYYVYGRTPGALNQFWAVNGTSFTDTGASGNGGNSPTSVGDRWLVKNLFELKNARNVVIEYNVMENNWPHGQAGYAILLTPRNQDGTCYWCVVENVTFNYNIVRNVAAGFNILGYDNISPSKQTRNITIRHNLFQGMLTWMGGTAWFMLISDSTANLTIDHNTIDADGTAFLYVWASSATVPYQVTGLQFTNNAVRHGLYGINGPGYTFGNGILNYYAPDSVVRGNWMQGGYPTRYPTGNYFTGTFADAFVDAANGNYQATPGGVLARAATDGTDIGADLVALGEGTKGVAVGRMTARPVRPINLRVVK